VPVYLDHNATTPLHPQVLEAMMPLLSGPPANGSSVHRYGRAARGALDRAREQVAALIGAEPGEIIFTSGGTESNNLALLGQTAGQTPGRLALSRIEHESVLQPSLWLAEHGWTIDLIDVDSHGRVTTEHLRAALHADTRLTAVMLANNQTGVLQDVAALAELNAERGVPLHCDAAQAAGKIPVDFRALGVQTMTLSAHKLYGPQGVGALVVDKRVELAPLLRGGGQERGLRSGTHNLAGIVGFGAAAQLAADELARREHHLRRLRDALEQRLSELPSVVVFGQAAARLPNTVQFAVRGFAGETLLMQLDREGFAVSSGSACHSGVNEPSHVLAAMGVPTELALGAVRVSLGIDNTDNEVQSFADALRKVIGRIPAAVALLADA
jgi:cysteine desulfurase